MRRHTGSYRISPSHPRSSLAHGTLSLTLSHLLIGALLSSPSLPASHTTHHTHSHRTAAPLLALALGDAASQVASSLLAAWAEAYGVVGGDLDAPSAPLPPANLSLPPGVPAAPHLEDCARVSAEREAAERRGAGGEEPAWTRGAPRRADAAAAGAAAAASSGCSGQAEGERGGVPQPPWVRGPDAANLPLTRVVQRDIWRHQFPSGDCTNRRLLIASWAKTHAHGVGSQIHYMSALLSVAMQHNRTLVEQPDGFDRARIPACEAAGHNSQWECFFFPLASSACRHVIQQALQQNPDKIPHAENDYADVAARDDQIVAVGYANPTRLSMEAGAADLWGDASLRSPCTVQLGGKLATLTERQRKVHWWRAQAVRFIMRWPSAHLCHVTNQERHRAFGTVSANHVARFLQTQSESLSALSHSISASLGASTAAAIASATPAGANSTAAATACEARRQKASDQLAALASSTLSFQSDASGSGARGNGDTGNDAGWSVGVHEPYMPRPIVSLHVRGTDKFAEMGLSSLDSHVFHMTRIRPHALHLQHVWLNTETQANIDQTKEHPSWSFFYSSNARQGAAGSLRQYERDQSVAVSLASVLIAVQCDLFVGSLGSNWSRLMNELRSTNGRLLAGFVADNVEEW